MPLQLFAVTPAGPQALPTRAGAQGVHELFDGLPLGVYSALRTFDHDRFLGLGMHLDRTDRSMELLGWSERLDRPRLCAALDTCVRSSAAPEAVVRFDVLAAPAPELGTTERTLIAVGRWTSVPEAYRTNGVVVRLSPLRRARPLIKVARFVVERRPFPLGRQEAYEHLIVDDSGRILEGSSSNFLAVRGGRIHATGDEALQGVTQRIVLELAGELGLEPVRAPLAPAELAEVEEAFLTGSTRGIVPVVAVEEQRIGTGRPGPWTRRLDEAYLAHAKAQARRATEL